MEYRKVFLKVLAEFSSEGGLKPLSFEWEDGRNFTIEKIEKVERAPARGDALLPIRYLCLISGKRKYLYFLPRNLRWFLEIPNLT